MALKYGYSRTRDSSGTSYTDRSGGSASESEATSSGGRRSRSPTSEIIVRDEQGYVTQATDQSLIGKQLTKEESQAISTGQFSYADIERERSVAKTRQNIADSKLATSLQREEVQTTPTDTPQGRAIQEAVSRSYTETQILRSQQATEAKETQARKSSQRLYDPKTQTFYPDDPEKRMFFMSARPPDETPQYFKKPEERDTSVTGRIKRGYGLANEFFSKNVMIPLGIGSKSTAFFTAQKDKLKEDVDYWQTRVDTDTEKGATGIRPFLAEGALKYSQFALTSGQFMIGSEEQAREEIRERPLGVAIKYGIGYGVGKGVQVVAGLGAVAKGGVNVLGKVAGGFYGYTVGKQVVEAPTPEMKGRVAGKTIVDLTAFMGGAKTAAKAPARKIVGEVKTTTASKSTVKTAGGKFNVQQNVPQPKPQLRRTVEFKEATLGKLLPKTKVRLQITGNKVIESRTFLGRTTQLNYKYDPSKFASLKTVESFASTKRSPVKYSHEGTIAKQKIASKQEFTIKETNLKGQVKKATVVTQKDTGGLYTIQAKKGYGVEVMSNKMFKGRMVGSETKLVEIGQSKIKISKSPQLWEEVVVSKFTGKGIGQVSQTLTTKAPARTIKTIYHASQTTVAPKTPVKDFVKQVPYISRQMMASKAGQLLTHQGVSNIVQPQVATQVGITQSPLKGDLIPRGILVGENTKLVGILGITDTKKAQQFKDPPILTKPGIVTRQIIQPKTIVKPIIDVKEIQDIVQVPTQIVRSRSTTIQKVVQRTIQVPVQQTQQRQVTTQITQPRVKQMFSQSWTRQTPPPVTPPIVPAFKPPRIQKSGMQGFDVYTKKFGKIVKINKNAYSEKEAYSFGRSRIGKTARASFIVVASANKRVGRFYGEGVKSDFYINKAGWNVEKRGRRIKSPGEVFEISRKGQRAIRKKKKKKLLSIFGT